MKKAVRSLCTLLKGILFIGFSIQIIFGLVWMCFNFMEVQAFGTPEGFIYPLFLRVFGNVPQILYLLQLVFAYFAGDRLLRPVLKGKAFERSWYVLAVLTLPTAMQCHMALLPYSFVESFLFLEVSCCLDFVCDKDDVKTGRLAAGGVCWLALSFLLPEYGWLGGIPLLLVVLFRLPMFKKRLRPMTYCVLVIAAFGGMIAGVDSLTGKADGSGGSFWFSMASRTTWPTVWNDFRVWPEEIIVAVEPLIQETTFAPGNMERLIKPAIEVAVGKERTEAYYREMARIAWHIHGPVIIRQIGWDALVYVLPQVMLPLQLEGEGYDSCSGRNYDIMLGKHPLITRHYMDYSCWWFMAAFGITAFMSIAWLIAGEGSFEKGAFRFLFVCALYAGAVTVFYVMRGAGLSDYKCTLAVSAVWTVWSLYSMRKDAQR